MSPADAARVAVRAGFDAWRWWGRCGSNILLIGRRILYVLIALGTMWTAASGTLSGVVKAAETAAYTAVDRYVEDRIGKHLGPIVKQIEGLHDELATVHAKLETMVVGTDLASQLQRIESKLDGLNIRKR